MYGIHYQLIVGLLVMFKNRIVKYIVRQVKLGTVQVDSR